MHNSVYTCTIASLPTLVEDDAVPADLVAGRATALDAAAAVVALQPAGGGAGRAAVRGGRGGG